MKNYFAKIKYQHTAENFWFEAEKCTVISPQKIHIKFYSNRDRDNFLIKMFLKGYMEQGNVTTYNNALILEHEKIEILGEK